MSFTIAYPVLRKESKNCEMKETYVGLQGQGEKSCLLLKDILINDYS